MMTPLIPDLWRRKEDAHQLYSLYLTHLSKKFSKERIVSACRQIRRYAARGPGPAEGLFTFFYEIDTLCDLKKYKIAWQQLRLRDKIIFGEAFDPMPPQGAASAGWDLVLYHAPILFFLGRYRDGCTLLETSLGLCLGGRKMRSYHILCHVYNGTENPTSRYNVTLAHFYNRLGSDFSEWPQWKAFVKGFHPRLFQVAGIRRDELLLDTKMLSVFYQKLMSVHDERTKSGVSWGLADLIDSATTFRKRQEITRKERDEFMERNKPRHERINAKLLELFPELQVLLK